MCGCKGCQEITAVDLVNNTETTTQLPTKECGPINSTVKILSCECGITLDIYNASGILVESNQSGGYSDPVYFEFTNSTVWTPQIGEGYILTIDYNAELGAWVLYYEHYTLETPFIIGYYFTDSSCPTSIQEWDLSCNAIAFDKLGVFETAFFWQGTYQNGKKSYTFTSDWSGPDINYRIYWVPDSSIIPGCSAPPGTPAWVLEEEVGINVWTSSGFLFNSNECPFGFYIGDWEGETTRYSFSDLGVSEYNIKTTPIDCQCCDEKLIITTTIEGKPPVELTVEATIVTDELGNHYIHNGYPYYSFDIGEDTYYIFFNNNQNNWVVGPVVSNDISSFSQNTSNSLCPFGYYSTTFLFIKFWVKGYDCGNQTEEDFCEKLHNKQCEFATKTLKYLKSLQFGNTCCEELEELKNNKRILKILNCYDTRDIPANTTEYNTIPYIQIKRLLGC